MSILLESGNTIDLKCEEVLIPEFPALMWGTRPDGTAFFDATAYLASLNNPSFTVEDFRARYGRQIEAIAQVHSLAPDDLFCTNREGHHLINGHLCCPFLSDIDPQFCAYCYDSIYNLFVNGFVLSDSTILHMALERLTPELLQHFWNNGKQR